MVSSLKIKYICVLLLSVLSVAWFASHSQAQSSPASKTPSKLPAKRPQPTNFRSTSSPSASAAKAPAKPTVKPVAEWIWADGITPGNAPRGVVLFRKSIQLSALEQARIEIAANDFYELYVNGRRVSTSTQSEKLDNVDISAFVIPGNNLFAVKCENREGTTAGLFCRIYVKPRNEGWRGMGTSETWLASTTAKSGWQSVAYNDSNWKNAALNSKPRETNSNVNENIEAGEENVVISRPPVPSQTVATRIRLSDLDEEGVQEESSSNSNPLALDTAGSSGRFTTDEGFKVEEVLDNAATGSLIAMAFNEFGHIVASQEGGPLLLIYDADKNGIPERVRTYSDRVENIQGILPLNGDVFVTGDGPDGSGLYRLMDQNRDGTLEDAKLLVRFTGLQGEHGAHQIALGPDGMVYVVVGNHVQVENALDPHSSYRNTYEGDLVKPRQEDPSGHAQGLRAPGGTVIRLDANGERIQCVAGGLRNAYDLAFHPRGALYVHDSDMEADIGTTWHRMTSLFQIVEGGEYGWRSGWANQPDYYIDRLPALQTTGRSSPTGAIVYDHNVYPTRYQQSLFLADWSEGRILRVDTRPSPEGTFPKPIPFVIGRPMNITDMDVSPDGAIYFCTGGRGTAGGIYAVRWTGKPKDVNDAEDQSIAKAIRQPQLQSAWGRQSVAMVKRDLGADWDEEIAGVAYSPDNPARYRTRALDLMQLLGPVPTPEMLIELSRSPNEVMRAKTADLLALHPDNELALKRLNDMLADSSTTVQQSAASGLIRADATCNSDRLIPLLQSPNRVLAFSAMRLLQRQPVDVQRQLLETTEKPRVVIAAALSLAISNPDVDNALASVNAMNNLVKGFVSDQDFIDLLRAYEVTLANAKLRPVDTPELRDIVAKEFPAGEPKINRQLIRLATFFQTPEVVPIALRYLDKSDIPIAERVDVSLYLRMIQHAWTPKERTQLLRFFEKAQLAESGSSYSLYVMNATREFAKDMSESEAIEWLKEGSQSPNAALAALPKLPSQIDTKLLSVITSLDREIDKGGFESDTFKRLKTGITAILARSGDEASMNYLRAVWRRSPDRRPTVALALAQKPEGENWDYLVRSLGVIETYAAGEILSKLISVDVATEDSQALRQVIILGLRLTKENESPANAIALMEHWTGSSMHEPDMDANAEMAAWQDWYRGKFPELPEPILPEDQTQPQWSLDFIEQYLDGDSGKTGSIASGALVYTKAQCASCHRMGDKGATVGPDLTSLTKRFTRRETIESILYPSHVISDQYASKKVMTRDGKIVSGIMTKTPQGVSIRTSDLQSVTIDKEDIEEIVPSKQSIMPAALLDNLSPNEIRDLMCYLGYVPTTPQVAEPPMKGRITR